LVVLNEVKLRARDGSWAYCLCLEEVVGIKKVAKREQGDS